MTAAVFTITLLLLTSNALAEPVRGASMSFDLTPDGLVRDRGMSVAAQRSGRRIEYALIGLLVVAVG